MKIIFAGGGSGGHIFPSLAIAKNLKNSKKLFLISKNDLDEEILKETEFNYKKISSGKLRRYFSLENFTDFFKFIFGIFESLKIISQFKPDLIFSKGGFVSLPVAIAGKILGKKIILHESDVQMGLANEIISKFADKILFGRDIGNPINFFGNFMSEMEKKIFINEKDFPLSKKILLVSGGSQGSEEINNLIKNNLEEIVKDFFVIHLTGKGKSLGIKNKCYLDLEFLNGDDYFNFLQISDLIISRAGAGSVAEILFFQKSSILIPHDFGSSGHQVENSINLEKKGFCKKFLGNKDGNEKFLEILNSDFSDIQKNLKKEDFQNPVEKITEEVLSVE